MGKHWAIIVGINQYQSLQPLMYAQFDAIELWELFVRNLSLSPEQFTLLTDVAPSLYPSAAYPTRESIQQALERLCQADLAADDTLWLFFSGCGIHWEGQDFLLPIDGDVARVAQTGLALESIFQQLKKAPTDQVLVVLDMNRSQSALPDQTLGTQALALADSLGIPLLLSCHPEQFSQEIWAIRHGVFTTALLEGLRYHGCLTLAQLATYVEGRVPELCQHHWRPVQNPVAAIPPQSRYLMLVPPASVTQLPLTTQATEAISHNGLYQTNGSEGGTAVISRPTGGAASSAPPAADSPEDHPLPILPVTGSGTLEPQAAEPAPAATGSALVLRAKPEKKGGWLGDPWQRWGLLAALLLLGGVIARNLPVFLGGSQPGAPTATSPTETAPTSAAPTEVPEPEAATADADADAAGEPLFTADPTDQPADGASALERGRMAVADQRYGEALTWLSQVPLEQQTGDYNDLLETAKAGYDRAAAAPENALDSARVIIQPVSASLFNDAIEQARQVPVGDPYYDQAQADINRWSQVILDLARGRAAVGQFDQAIEAAGLVPDDRPQVYSAAQAAIARWQQQKQNRSVLQQAQASLQPDQATTYADAIVQVQQIPEGYPEYAIAQERIAQWSQDILVIARVRAAQGEREGAIAAAEKVPPNTVAYEQAQQLIQEWQLPQ